jgi:Xaa-Pro aminopeptidase
MKRYMLEEGADYPVNCHVHIWPGATYLTEPTDQSLKRGDILWMDAGAAYCNYKCDFGRMAVVGEPSSGQKTLYEYAVHIVQRCVEKIRPGLKVSDLYRTYEEYRGEYTYPFPSLAHGLGLDVVEPPNLIPKVDTVIRENMILAIEPGAMTSERFYKTEDNLVVTRDGWEVPSTGSRELRVIEP